MSASGLYAYLQQLSAAVELTSQMALVALHFHNQSDKTWLTKVVRRTSLLCNYVNVTLQSQLTPNHMVHVDTLKQI